VRRLSSSLGQNVASPDFLGVFPWPWKHKEEGAGLSESLTAYHAVLAVKDECEDALAA
jgi:hypothetical protein